MLSSMSLVGMRVFPYRLYNGNLKQRIPAVFGFDHIVLLFGIKPVLR